MTLPHLQEERRHAEKAIGRDFETALPRILGALLDAASHGLRLRPFSIVSVPITPAKLSIDGLRARSRPL